MHTGRCSGRPELLLA